MGNTVGESLAISTDGDVLGILDGDCDGEILGAALGFNDGADEGATLGILVAPDTVGFTVTGLTLGGDDGSRLGLLLGDILGLELELGLIELLGEALELALLDGDTLELGDTLRL